MSLNFEIDDTTRRNSLSALRWDAAWIDPALRRMAETAAQRSGLAIESWMERSIRQACDMSAMVAPVARLAEPIVAPAESFLESPFAIEREEARYADADGLPAATDSFPEAAAPAAPLLSESLLGDSLAPEFPEPEYDDDVPEFAEAAHPTAPEPEISPLLFADADHVPHGSAQTTPWRVSPSATGETRNSSVIWAAGIAAVLAFCAVVAVRDPSLLHGRLVAENDRNAPATPSVAPTAVATNAPLHVQPSLNNRKIALDMVPPPPSVAEDTSAPIPSPKIEIAPPTPVAAAPAPTPAPAQATDAISPETKSDDLPPPSVALAEPHPVQMASLPSSTDDRSAPVASREAEAEPAAAEPAVPASAAKPSIHVAAEPPAESPRAVAEKSTQVAMAPTAAVPPPSAPKSAGAGMAQDARVAADLETRVHAGDHVAEYRLGILYALGKGVPRDYEHAATLLRASAQAGLAEAQYDYGVLCDKGLGVTRDSATAVHWYAKAAEQGHPPAALNLGFAYAEGLGVARNLPEAARWFRRAAEAGLINAQFNLAYMFEQGAGVSKSLVDAYAWYSVAAEKGDQGAQAAMSRIAAKLTPHEMQFAKARIRAVKHVIRVQN
jgi:TPR repeat protein